MREPQGSELPHEAPEARQRAKLDGDVDIEEEREEGREGWSMPTRLPVVLSAGAVAVLSIGGKRE
jgi:hypothetical protein